MKTRALWILLPAFVAGACGPDEASSKYAASTLSGLCVQFAAASCDHAVKCGIAATAADCTAYGAQVQAACEIGTGDVQTQIDQGIVSVDYAAAATCLQTIATSCSANLDECFGNAKLIVGKRAVGTTCAGAQECVPTAFCKIVDNACSGTCTARAASGTPCGGDDACASGLVCGNGTCAKPAAHGEACSFAINCGPGLLCDSAVCKTNAEVIAECPAQDSTCAISGASCSSEASGPTICDYTYRTYGARGAACDPSGADTATEGLKRSCKFGSVCDPASKTCVAPFAVGTACESDNVCGIDGYCGTDNKCAKIPALGEACVEQCGENQACISGKCSKRLAVGATCAADPECDSYSCVEGKCVAECTAN